MYKKIKIIHIKNYTHKIKFKKKNTFIFHVITKKINIINNIIKIKKIYHDKIK